MTAIRKTKTAAQTAPRAKKAKLALVPAFDWAVFWAEQPDLPVVSAWAPTAPAQDDRPVTRSVVAQCYKEGYKTNGTKGRGNGDAFWAFCLRFLDENGRLIVAEWERFLDENGVRHEGWKRTGNGWEGRLRMSGSVVLRNMAKRGEPVFFDGAEVAF
jgi:hypothetical protein